MGKRKAVDIPTCASGPKKFKKWLTNKTSIIPNQGSRSLEDIDILKEKVEAILRDNSNSLPLQQGPPVTKIPDILKKKQQQPNSTKDIVPKMTIATTGLESPLIPFSGSDTVVNITCDLPVEDEAPRLPLSPEVVVIPMISCSNRFGPLGNDEGLCM
ncbi:hypothetical protein NDU88_004363 [Pleurodeles waltl]|uniref:Uncharacterized protein n=1 Tax=Pleurodeles waltl TaxID=8319 RepID=A0AAV7MT91_PLEWA|nr:hypothetical protein NDU88_004363 [Pleurodeles waltl]